MAVLLSTACSPALDWRETRLDPQGAVALFPCKPSLIERVMTVDGRSQKVSMLSCEAGGHTFALMSADMGSEVSARRAAQSWSLAAFENIGAVGEPVEAPRLKGMGAVWSVRLQGMGHAPGGQPIHEDVVAVAKGPRVFQAAVVSRGKPDPEAALVFHEGLALP